MLKISKAISASTAKEYFQGEYSHQYYSESGAEAGRWEGAAAERLGLVGGVSERDFDALLNGRNPETGAQLVQAAAGNGKHRAAFDFVFSAPKSVSIQALFDERLVEAHKQSAAAAFSAVEQYAQARFRGGTGIETTANLVAARFSHDTARPVGGRVDPQLHEHFVTANMTQRSDGEWRALEPRELYRSQNFGTAVYRSELAKRAQELGYEIDVGPRGSWEIKGYTREQIEAFSARREQIVSEAEKRGQNTPGGREIVTRTTREEKTANDKTETKKEWKQRAETHGIDGGAMRREASRRQPESAEKNLENAVSWALDHVTERAAVVSQREVETSALQRGMGSVELSEVQRGITAQRITGVIQDAGERRGIALLTTREEIARETRVIALAAARRGRETAIEPRGIVGRNTLGDDQRAAVEHVLKSRDGVTAVVGKAGTGKTTALRALKDELQSAGWTVRGFAPTTKAAGLLAESGIASTTVASLCARKQEQKTTKKREVWVVDEASLLSTRAAAGLLLRARDAGARVVLVGDRQQHQAVEAGKPFDQLLRHGVASVSLDHIRRQRDPELRKAVERAAAGDAAGAVRMLDGQGRVVEIVDEKARHDAIAKDYVAAVRAGKSALVVAPSNAERRLLNERIRTELAKKKGALGEGKRLTILVSKQLTRAEKRVAGSYEVGDVVRYGRGSKVHDLEAFSTARVVEVDARKNLVTVARDGQRDEKTYDPARLSGVEVYKEEQREFAAGDRVRTTAVSRGAGAANGEIGVIEKINGCGVTLKTGGGRRLKLNAEEAKHLDYGYATTSHSAQGATVDRVLVAANTKQSSELLNDRQTYVSVSRAREDVRIYTDDRASLAKAAGRETDKVSAVEAVERAGGRDSAARGRDDDRGR